MYGSVSAACKLATFSNRSSICNFCIYLYIVFCTSSISGIGWQYVRNSHVFKRWINLIYKWLINLSDNSLHFVFWRICVFIIDYHLNCGFTLILTLVLCADWAARFHTWKNIGRLRLLCLRPSISDALLEGSTPV